jgi:raffinose/stachyose/melibiose transport system permease protein
MNRNKVLQAKNVSPFIIPGLAINLFVILVPSILTLVLSFFEWDGLGPIHFVGIKNFIILLSERSFWQAIIHNIIWTLIFITIPVGLGLLGAELLRRTKWNFLESFYFLPVTLPAVIVAIIWRYIYDPMRGIGKIIGIALLGHPSTALYAIALANIWAWWGFLCAVFFSAIQGVPVELYESATLDGANKWQEFRYITLPQIAPSIVLMEIMTIIWSFQVFDWVWATTQGGPAGASELLATLLYKEAFYSYRIGTASAIGVVISLFGLLAITLLYYLRRRGMEV